MSHVRRLIDLARSRGQRSRSEDGLIGASQSFEDEWCQIGDHLTDNLELVLSGMDQLGGWDWVTRAGPILFSDLLEVHAGLTAMTDTRRAALRAQLSQQTAALEQVASFVYRGARAAADGASLSRAFELLQKDVQDFRLLVVEDDTVVETIFEPYIEPLKKIVLKVWLSVSYAIRTGVQWAAGLLEAMWEYGDEARETVVYNTAILMTVQADLIKYSIRPPFDRVKHYVDALRFRFARLLDEVAQSLAELSPTRLRVAMEQGWIFSHYQQAIFDSVSPLRVVSGHLNWLSSTGMMAPTAPMMLLQELPCFSALMHTVATPFAMRIRQNIGDELEMVRELRNLPNATGNSDLADTVNAVSRMAQDHKERVEHALDVPVTKDRSTGIFKRMDKGARLYADLYVGREVDLVLVDTVIFLETGKTRAQWERALSIPFFGDAPSESLVSVTGKYKYPGEHEIDQANRQFDAASRALEEFLSQYDELFLYRDRIESLHLSCVAKPSNTSKYLDQAGALIPYQLGDDVRLQFLDLLQNKINAAINANKLRKRLENLTGSYSRSRWNWRVVLWAAALGTAGLAYVYYGYLEAEAVKAAALTARQEYLRSLDIATLTRNATQVVLSTDNTDNATNALETFIGDWLIEQTKKAQEAAAAGAAGTVASWLWGGVSKVVGVVTGTSLGRNLLETATGVPIDMGIPTTPGQVLEAARTSSPILYRATLARLGAMASIAGLAAASTNGIVTWLSARIAHSRIRGRPWHLFEKEQQELFAILANNGLVIGAALGTILAVEHKISQTAAGGIVGLIGGFGGPIGGLLLNRKRGAIPDEINRLPDPTGRRNALTGGTNEELLRIAHDDGVKRGKALALQAMGRRGGMFALPAPEPASEPVSKPAKKKGRKRRARNDLMPTFGATRDDNANSNNDRPRSDDYDSVD